MAIGQITKLAKIVPQLLSLVGDLARMRLGMRVHDIYELMQANRQTVFAYNLEGYHRSSLVPADGNLGGGTFYYRPDVAKSMHDGGGRYLDPDRIGDFPTDWGNETQKAAWYAPSSSGTGVFVREERRMVFLEEYGASSVIANNSKAMQKAFASGVQAISYLSAIRWSETVLMETWGQVFCGPTKPGQYITSRRLTFEGAADTYAIHVRAPGCRIYWNDMWGGATRPNCVRGFRNQEMIPGNADLDLSLEENNFINFKEDVRLVGRNTTIRNNLFSLHTTGVALQQFIYTSGTPEYYQDLARGYRGFEFTENRFHASSGVDIRNMETGHENLYGCLINDNVHDTDGTFFEGSINDSTVNDNKIHRLISSKVAFLLYRCRDVTFDGVSIGGEIRPNETATFAAAAFKFFTKEVSGVNITDGVWVNIAGTPVQFNEPPEGMVNINGVTATDVCWNARAGAQSLPIVDIANVSGDGRGVDGFRFTNCILNLQPITGGAVYGSLVRFVVRGSANKGVDVFGNTVRAGGVIPNTNLVTSSTTLFHTQAYSGDGTATRVIALPHNPTFVTVCAISLGEANRFQSVQVVRGTSSANDMVEMTETGIIVKATMNTLNKTYTIVAF